MNKWIGMGRLTRTAELRYGAGAEPLAVARFSLAVDRKYKRDGEPSADFFNCVAFGKLAELITKTCNRGTKIAVVAHVQTGSYTNKEGIKVKTTDFVIDEFEYCEKKSENSFDGQPYASSPDGVEEIPDDEFVNMDGISDDELPFK